MPAHTMRAPLLVLFSANRWERTSTRTRVACCSVYGVGPATLELTPHKHPTVPPPN